MVAPSTSTRSGTYASPSTSDTHLDESFYFQDVIFQVEDSLFRVLRRNFEHDSEVFQDMFRLPNGAATGEGTSIDQPIVLENVKKNDFVQLLRVMFPRKYGQEEDLTAEQWMSALKLATMWSFETIRTTALDRLSTLLQDDPARRVVVANNYNVDGWLLPALNALAQRTEPLGLDDVAILGLDCVLRLARVREMYVPQCTNCGYAKRSYVDAYPMPHWPPGLGVPPPAGLAPARAYHALPRGLHDSRFTTDDNTGERTGRAAYNFERHIKEVFEL